MRLDQALVRAGLAESRTKAQRLIAQGLISVNGTVRTKGSFDVADSDALENAGAQDYVGRAALKLKAALETWNIQVSGVSCLDIGASTGGFTEVLLEHGASRVVALDVGTGQLHARLRSDSRVIALEGVNARELTPERWVDLGIPHVSLIVADVSFISLTHILPAVIVCAPLASWVVLIKPQFEVGREHVSGGIVTKPEDQERAIRRVVDCASDAGLFIAGLMASPITGEAGNREYLCWLTSKKPANQTQWSQEIHDLAHSGAE